MFAHFVRNVICILVTIFLFLKIGSSCYKLYEIMCTSLDKDRACQEYSDIILLFWFLFCLFFSLHSLHLFSSTNPIVVRFLFSFLFFVVCWLDSLYLMWEIIFPQRKQTLFTTSS